MKRQLGKDIIIIFGSGSIVSQLTKHGLNDKYQFTVCPIFLGTGGQSMLNGRIETCPAGTPGIQDAPVRRRNTSLRTAELGDKDGKRKNGPDR